MRLSIYTSIIVLTSEAVVTPMSGKPKASGIAITNFFKPKPKPPPPKPSTSEAGPSHSPNHEHMMEIDDDAMMDFDLDAVAAAALMPVSAAGGNILTPPPAVPAPQAISRPTKQKQLSLTFRPPLPPPPPPPPPVSAVASAAITAAATAIAAGSCLASDTASAAAAGIGQRMLRQQLDRFGAAACGPAAAPSSAAVAVSEPLNARQRLVSESRHGQLSVRAGAGTGKTFTMVQRAKHLVSEQHLEPGSLLLITFSVKAAAELEQRLQAAFPAAAAVPAAAVPVAASPPPLPAPGPSVAKAPISPSRQIPVAKTFHALAFFWIRLFWRAAGLGARPTPLTGKASQRKLMQRVFEERADARRLRWLRKHLHARLEMQLGSKAAAAATWDEVVALLRHAAPQSYASAKADAEAAVVADASGAASTAATPSTKPVSCFLSESSASVTKGTPVSIGTNSGVSGLTCGHGHATARVRLSRRLTWQLRGG